jgi:ABC-type lipoprotein export system ATPase subunit
MGPSGSGKTTFLDFLTGRRKYESTNEDVRKMATAGLLTNN